MYENINISQVLLSFSWVLQIRNILFFYFFLVKFTNIHANMLVLSPIMCRIWENYPFSKNIVFWWFYAPLSVPAFYPRSWIFFCACFLHGKNTDIFICCCCCCQHNRRCYRFTFHIPHTSPSPPVSTVVIFVFISSIFSKYTAFSSQTARQYESTWFHDQHPLLLYLSNDNMPRHRLMRRSFV